MVMLFCISNYIPFCNRDRTAKCRISPDSSYQLLVFCPAETYLSAIYVHLRPSDDKNAIQRKNNNNLIFHLILNYGISVRLSFMIITSGGGLELDPTLETLAPSATNLRLPPVPVLVAVPETAEPLPPAVSDAAKSSSNKSHSDVVSESDKRDVVVEGGER